MIRTNLATIVSGLILLLLALPVVLPLFRIDWFESHEGASYPARIVEVRRCWDGGLLSARWFPDLAGGRGYPFLSFYAPLCFYAATLLHVLGLSVAGSLKVVITIATLLGLGGAYCLARHGLGRIPSLTVAALYTYAPYHLRDLWTRGDIAEYLAMGLLPWALAAAIRISDRTDLARAIWAGIAGAAVILSHNLVGLFAGLGMAVAGVVALASGSDVGRRRVLRALGKAAATALLLSAFFWLPALAEKKWVQLDNLRQGIFEVERNFLTASDLIGIRAPAREYVSGQAEAMSFEMGLLLLAVPLAPLVLLRNDRRARSVGALAAALLVLGVTLATRPGAVFYEIFSLLRFVGFPWRFLSVASLGAALLVGAGLSGVGARIPRPAAAAIATVIGVGAIALTAEIRQPLAEIRPLEPMLNASAYAAAGFTASAANEYLPVWAQAEESVPFREGVALAGAGRIDNLERGVARWSFVVESKQDVVVVLQDFFFPGWEGHLDGRPVELRPRPVSGHIEFDCPAGRHSFKGRLRATRLRWIAGWVSAVTAAAILLFALRAAGRRVFARTASLANPPGGTIDDTG
jgi:hypothetical protein